MNAGFLNVFEHAAHIHLLAVAQRIDVAFDGAFEEAVQIHRMVRRDARRFCHEGTQMRRVVGDFHAAAAEHVARANEQREPNAVSDAFGFLEARGHACGGVRNVELVEHGAEAFTVFGQVNCLGARAHNGHARFLKRVRELQRRLAAERHHNAVGLLDIDDIHDVFVGERLEIQAVACIVVGGHGFGVAVHHDGFVAGLVQRVARMHTTVVELDALANAVGTCAQNHGFRLVDGHDFRIAEARRRARSRNVGRFVGLVMVFGFAREFSRTRVDGLERRHNAKALAIGAHDDFLRAREVSDLGVGKTVLLRDAHSRRVEVFEAQAFELVLHGGHIGDAMQEPRVDAARLVHRVNGPTATQGLGHIEDAVFRGACHAFVEMLFVEIVFAIGAQARAAVFQRTHGLAERFLKRAADAHDFAHGLHARRKRRIGALEFLECEARHLHHAIVDRRLEACRRDARNVVRDFVERVAHGQARGGFRDRETGRLRRKRRGAAHARVHFDDDQAAVFRVERELHVRTARFDADFLQNGERGHAHALVFHVGKRLRRCHRDGVARMNAHGVNILDGAHDDAVAGLIAHDFHLVFFPADDAFFHKHLAGGRKLQTLRHDLAQLLLVVGDAAARAAEREARAKHAGVAHLAGELDGVFDGVRITAARAFQTYFFHGLSEQLAVFAALDGCQIAANHFNAIAIKHARFRQLNGRIQARLTTKGRQQGVGMLFGDDTLDEFSGNRLHVGAVGQAGVGHDGSGVRIHEHHFIAVFLEHLARLGARVVELARLANNDGARANNEDAFDVGTFGHCLGLLRAEDPAGEAVLRNVDVQVVGVAVHQAAKRREQVVRIGRTRVGLGVVLHRESILVEQLNAFASAIVQVDVRQANAAEALVFNDGRDAALRPEAKVAVGRMLGHAAGKLGHEFAEAREHQAEAVVLRGDFHLAAHEVHDGLVAAAMTELELLHFAAACEADHLMTQTNAEHRHLANKLARLLVGFGHGIGVARAVGEKNAVGFHGEHVSSGSVPRHYGKVAAHTHEARENRLFHAAVIRNHVIFLRRRSGHSERLAFRHPIERLRGGAAHGFGEIVAHQARSCGDLFRKRSSVEVFGRQNGSLRAEIANMANERTRIDALDSHDVLALEEFGQAHARAPIRRRAAHIMHDQAAQSRLGRLRIVEVHTVVADLGIGHRDNLTRIRRVGNDLEIALERRVEANLARNFACGTACPAVESGSVLQ